LNQDLLPVQAYAAPGNSPTSAMPLFVPPFVLDDIDHFLDKTGDKPF
jgi:hypothetical protein